MDLSSIAWQGLAQADAQLDAAASGLASAGGATPNGANLDAVDLSTQALTTVDQIQQNLIDIKA